MKSLWFLIAVAFSSISGFSQENTEVIKAELHSELNEGIRLVENKDFKKAKKHFKKLKISYPNELNPAYFLEVTEYLLCSPWSKKLPQIIENLDQLAIKFPSEPKIYFRRALAKLLILQYEEAKLDLEICRNLSAVIPETYYYLGYIGLKSHFNQEPNINFHKAMKNFELFKEIADSTHFLYKSATLYRANSQWKNLIGGFPSEENKLLSEASYLMPNEKPLLLFSLDTVQYISCNDLYYDFGIFTSLPSKKNSAEINYSDFLNARKLSDLIEINGVISFQVVSSVVGFDEEKNEAYAHLHEIHNSHDGFSEHILNRIQELTAGEYIYFENIKTETGTIPNFGFRLNIRIE